jgi:hypothetical protein
MNLSRYLNAYNHIALHGEKQNEKYILGELSAWHDFDGYTCYIGYKDLTMTLYFHSRFSYDFDDESTLKAFSVIIENIETNVK